jgi:hypothetical protein
LPALGSALRLGGGTGGKDRSLTCLAIPAARLAAEKIRKDAGRLCKALQRLARLRAGKSIREPEKRLPMASPGLCDAIAAQSPGATGTAASAFSAPDRCPPDQGTGFRSGLGAPRSVKGVV